MSHESKEMVKSWAKVFLASAIALYMSGTRDPLDLINAGVIAVLPLIYTWLDPHDKRFGRGAD